MTVGAPLKIFSFDCYYSKLPFSLLGWRPFYTKLLIIGIAPIPLTIIASIAYLIGFLTKYGSDFFESEKYL